MLQNKRPRAHAGGIWFSGRCLALAGSLFVSASPSMSFAQEPALIPDNVIFVTSTGYWEESGDPLSILDPKAGKTPETKPLEPTTPPAQRGYYKLIAVRQPEGNTHIFLQQIALDASGPKMISSAELDEFSAMKVYVTDIRPETSNGVVRQPGLFATVYLKTDPTTAEPETWTVLIDDIGDIKVERETN